MTPIRFTSIDWSVLPRTLNRGERGQASSQTVELDGLRIRTVEYSAGYLADHWCSKGHIVHCIEGSYISEEKNEERTLIQQGMTWVASDNMSMHRSFSEHGVKLLIIDGDFLSSPDALTAKAMNIAIAGPYSAATPEDRQRNLDCLNEAAAAVFEKGHIPFIGVNAALPVTEKLASDADRYEAIMRISLALVDQCDALLIIGESPGALREKELMQKKKRPVYASIAEIPEIR